MVTKAKMIVYYWKTRGLSFKQKCFSINNLKLYSLIVTEDRIIFKSKIGDIHSSSCEKTVVFCFEQILIILVLVTIATKFEIKRNSFAYF